MYCGRTTSRSQIARDCGPCSLGAFFVPPAVLLRPKAAPNRPAYYFGVISEEGVGFSPLTPAWQLIIIDSQIHDFRFRKRAAFDLPNASQTFSGPRLVSVTLLVSEDGSSTPGPRSRSIYRAVPWLLALPVWLHLSSQGPLVGRTARGRCLGQC